MNSWGRWPRCSSAVNDLRTRRALCADDPPKFRERLASIAFKSPQRELSEMDARAKRGGMSRSDCLRRLVDRDLALPQLAKPLKIKLMFYFSCIG